MENGYVPVLICSDWGFGDLGRWFSTGVLIDPECCVPWPHLIFSMYPDYSGYQWAQNICKTFVQRRPNVEDVGRRCTNVMQMFCVCWGAGHTVTEGAGVDTRWPLTDLGLSPFPLLSISTILGQYRGCQFQAISSICPVKHPVWYAVPIVSAGSLSRLAQGLHFPL